MPITTILFDLDGTIADTNEIILRTLAETLEYANGRSWSREELLPHWGMILREQLLTLDPIIDLELVVPYYRRIYAQYHKFLLAEFPGVRELLGQLKTAGYRLGVVTSKKRMSAQLTLDSLRYRGFFDDIIVDEDTIRHKPAPDPLLLALVRFGVTADEAIYIGDNPDDITAAHAAGIPGVAVGWCLRPRRELEAAGADLVLDHADDLLPFLASAGKFVATL